MTNGKTDRLRQLELAWRVDGSTDNLIAYLKALLRSGDASDARALLRTVLDRADDPAELHRSELHRIAESILGEVIDSADPEQISRLLRQALDDGLDGAVHDIVERTPTERLSDALRRADPSDLEWERILREAGIPSDGAPLTGGARGVIDIIVDAERATGEPFHTGRERVAERIAELSPQQRGVIRGRLEQLQRRGWLGRESSLGRFFEEALNSPYVVRKMRFPGKSGSWIEVVGEGNKRTIVVRDRNGVKKRIPIDRSFDPDTAIDDLLREVPPGRVRDTRRMLRRLVGGLVVAWIVYDTIETFRRIADPEFTRAKIAELVAILVQGAGEQIQEWVHAFFRLPGDPALSGIGWFMSSAIWPFVEEELEQLTRRERIQLARRILAYLRRAFPVETGGSQIARRSTPSALRGRATRRGRDQRPYATRPARAAPRPQPPAAPRRPPRPAKYPQLSRADLDWWLRGERRQLEQDEAELAAARGRLRAYRWSAPELVEEVEARIARLRDAIRRARARIEEYERARSDPHRDPGRSPAFPPLEPVEQSKPLDIEYQESIERQIERLNREIDELTRVRAGLKPHEDDARALLDRWLRERARERDKMQRDLERLKEVQREERRAHGSWLIEVMGDEIRDEPAKSSSRFIAPTVAEIHHRIVQLELLGAEVEIADAYRLGLDVGRFAMDRQVRTDTSLARQAEFLGPRELEDLARRVDTLLEDLIEARSKQKGRAGFGALLDRIRERPPQVITIDEELELQPPPDPELPRDIDASC